MKPASWKCPRCDSTRPASMGARGICVHPGTSGRILDEVAVDMPLFGRADIVRAVLAYQWAVAIEIGADAHGLGASAPSRFVAGQDEQHDYDVEVLAALPCAEDFVAEMLDVVTP